MSLHHSPKIVTNGLVLCLDAGNRKSYSGSGTAWRDLSGNNNDGILTNGPTFSSANSGSIVFDGVNDYASISNNSILNLSSVNKVTVSSWFYAAADGILTTREIIHKRNNDPTYVSYGISWALVGTDNKLFSRIGFTDGTTSDLFSKILNKNQWYFGTQTFDGTTHYMYINGLLDTNSQAYVGKTIKDDGFNVTVATFNGNQEFFIGRIATCQIYNRALTSAEVLQNYNATKGRFQLP